MTPKSSNNNHPPKLILATLYDITPRFTLFDVVEQASLNRHTAAMNMTTRSRPFFQIHSQRWQSIYKPEP